MDIGKSFEALVSGMYIRYRGVLIENNGTYFKVYGVNYPTLYLAKKRVDLAYNKFATLKIYK